MTKPFKILNRRDYLRTTAVLGSGIVALGAQGRGFDQDSREEFDRYRGLKSLRFEATGYFRIEKRERWWFVTPEGHGWLGFGINHIHPNWLNASYCADVWKSRFGAAAFDDEAWRAGLRTEVQANMAACGYNHFGVHNTHSYLTGLEFSRIVSVQFVKIPHYLPATAGDFLDVFSPSFAEHCDAMAAREVAPYRKDAWVTGFAFTDCPIFTDAEAAERPVATHGSGRATCPTWPRVLRNLPASAPGKQAWLAMIRHRYADDINLFNDCYGVSFKTWEELRAAEHWRDLTDMANARELLDNRAFLEQVVEQYYATACAAIRRYAPHHLIFGDKLNGNTDGADSVVAITAKHTDLVLYQMYARWDEQRMALDRWHQLTDKPAFNGDGTFSCPNPMMPNPHGPHARDQAERGQWAFDFGKNAFARPDFVGWSVCGWVDTWQTMRGKEQKQHSGFFTPLGEPHQAYIRRLHEISEQLYTFAQ